MMTGSFQKNITSEGLDCSEYIVAVMTKHEADYKWTCTYMGVCQEDKSF